MKALPLTEPITAVENIIPLAIEKPKSAKAVIVDRFKIEAFQNRGGSTSWRVSGSKRDGTRIRENFSDAKAAECRKAELGLEFLRGHAEMEIQATRLSPEKLAKCETAIIKLGDDWDRIVEAVDYWLKHGKALAVKESVRLDEAFNQFVTWVDASTLRDHSKKNLKRRVKVFITSNRNVYVSEVTPDTIDKFLKNRTVSLTAKDNDRRAVSRFFSWCIERERRWIAMNPCREVKVEKPEASAPAILALDECAALLKAAQKHKRGALAPYVALCLFGGIRPFEASRLTWQQINLDDGEIRLEGNQTKTGTTRTITVCPTLKAWLKEYKGKPIFPQNWRRDFDTIKRAAGYGKPTEKHPKLKAWPLDVMRHTAISHYFRETGSYGRTAEQFGNSESIIKKHYQSRVSSAETKQFYALRPGAVARRRTKHAKSRKVRGNPTISAAALPLAVAA